MKDLLLNLTDERKIIQLSSVPDRSDYTVVAVCDDGTIWRFNYKDGCWHRVKNVPQPEPENKPLTKHMDVV